MKLPKFYYDEHYKQNFWFFLGWNPDDVEKFMWKKGWNFDSLNLVGGGKCVHFVKPAKEVIAVWIRYKFDYAVLAHECVHAVNMTFESRGIKPDLLNDEPQAYFVECLVRQALK